MIVPPSCPACGELAERVSVARAPWVCGVSLTVGYHHARAVCVVRGPFLLVGEDAAKAVHPVMLQATGPEGTVALGGSGREGTPP